MPPKPPVDEEPEGEPKPINIDIYEMEMQKGLPHWLSPMGEHSAKHRARRREHQIARSNAAQGKDTKDK